MMRCVYEACIVSCGVRVCEGSTHPQQAGHSCIMSGSAVPSSKPASSTFTNSVDIMCRGGVGDQVGAPLVWLADSRAAAGIFGRRGEGDRDNAQFIGTETVGAGS